MQFPLARDQQGNPFDLPSEAAYWRVRRHTGGRPSTVLGPDGEPLYLGIVNDRSELQAYVPNGSIRLEAVDSEYKPVRAPVGYVELGPSSSVAVEPARKAEPQTESLELVRTAIESLTRSVEATQRSQVEHERGMAHREKMLAEAQIEMQRRDKEMMSLLLDKATGGKPKDSLTALQEHLKFQKTVEQVAGGHQRNAAIVGPDAGATEEKAEDDGGVGKWVTMLAPLVPMLTNYVASSMEDPQKAESLRRNGAAFGQIAESFVRGVAGDNRATQPTAQAARVEQPRSTPRALREVLAVLDDTDADSLAEYLDELDDAAFAATSQHAQSIGTIEERAVWARGLASPAVPSSTVGSVEPLPRTLPPALLPVIALLTAEERAAALHVLQLLDLATVEQLTARLLILSPEQAASMIRETLADMNRRGASLAQRAVFAALDRTGGPSSGEVTS